MSFKSGANGIEKKGKTKGKNLGDDGPKVLPKDGGKKTDRKSTRLNSSHSQQSRMPSSA